jgi:ATP/maltotriose-dependent transcriptional regulator MalT
MSSPSPRCNDRTRRRYRIRAVGPSSGDAPFAILWARAHGLSESLLEAEAETEEVYRHVPPDRVAARTLAGLLLGRAALSRGHVQRAGHFLREAVLRTRASDPLGLSPWCLAGLAQSAALAGDLTGAEKALADAERLQGAPLPAYGRELTVARAWVVAARGELSRAAATALTAAENAAGSQGKNFAALALHDAARLGASAVVADRLVEAAARARSGLLRACAAHAVALRAGDVKGLAEAGARFEGLGADLLAAEAWTEASAVHRSGGRGPEASVAGRRAHASLDRCEGARTPALIPEVILAPSLTPRQREVARLVAMGLSNREVAGQLYVSLRTVENHLYQVYAKLDVSDRHGLTRRLCALATI